MYDLKNIMCPKTDPYKYLAEPIFNMPEIKPIFNMPEITMPEITMPKITTTHKLVLVAVGTFNETEIYKSETLIDNNLLQSCIEDIEDAANYIIDKKITEFKQYLARHGEDDEFEVTVYLNDEVINKIKVDSGYI